MTIPNPNKLKADAKDWVSFLLPIIVTIAIVVIVWKIYKSAKAGGAAIGETIGNSVIAQQTGIPQVRVNAIRQMAEELWDRGVRSYYLLPGYYYDEELFVEYLNQMVSPGEAALMSRFYKEKSGNSLRSAITESFSTTQKSRVNPTIMQNIY